MLHVQGPAVLASLRWPAGWTGATECFHAFSGLSIPCSLLCSWSLNLRVAWIASGCDQAAKAAAAPHLPAALLQHPVLSTCPCSGVWVRTLHLMGHMTILNPWVSIYAVDGFDLAGGPPGRPQASWLFLRMSLCS